MAAITSSFPFKPLLSQTTTTTRPSSISSLESSINGVRLRNLNHLKLGSTRSVTTRVCISARFGSYRSSNARRSREKQNESVDDPNLDISGIRSETVRLIDAEENMIGVVSKTEAIQQAEDAELDLVILSKDAKPPVVKIMDYTKYRYEQQKKKREQQKKSSATRVDIKELKMGYKIDVHDYSVRRRAAEKFLKEGNKVKIIVHLKGRENEFKNNAIELIRRFQTDLGELATEESKNFKDKNINMVLVPNKTVIAKAQEQSKRKKEKPAQSVTPVVVAAVTEDSAGVAAVTEDLAGVAAVTEVSADAPAVSEISAGI